MPAKNLIVIGSGAGGMQPLETILRGLPASLDAAVLIVQHIPGSAPNDFLLSLNQASETAVRYAENGEEILAGRIYLAPPNSHLLVKDGNICLGKGPRENRARPAIDVLFRTAAHSCGGPVTAVLLSGVLNDGTAGLLSVKRHGGQSIVQSPDEAVFDGMPRSAIAYSAFDQILPSDRIAPALLAILAETAERKGGADAMSTSKHDADYAEVGGPGLSNLSPVKAPSALTCPACGGAVWECQDNTLRMFKCHVGHSYTAELMLEEQSEAVDEAAWVLLRSLEENIFFRRQLAAWARDIENFKEADYHLQQAEYSERRSKTIRTMLLEQDESTG